MISVSAVSASDGRLSMAPLNPSSSVAFLPSVIALIVVLVALSVSIVACGCCKRRWRKRQPREKSVEIPWPVVVGGVGDRFQQVTSGFAINLFRCVACPTLKGAREPSCLISPFALQISFGVCMMGANGVTLTEMMTTLFPNSGTITYAEHVIKDMVESTQSCRMNSFFRVFTRVYAHSAVQYSEEFKNLVVDELHDIKSFTPIDYRIAKGDAMAKATHDWMAAITHGQLSKFESTSWRPVNPSKSSFCVVSAATIHCRWAKPFHRHHTQFDRPFFIDLGDSIPVTMMKQVNTLGYYESELMQCLRMEYRESDMAIYVLLPRSITGLTKLERNLTPDYLIAACRSAQTHQQLVEVTLPKFKLECEIGEPLIVALSQLGSVTSFLKGKADFSHFIDDRYHCPKSLWISGAVHKTLIEFTDEQLTADNNQVPSFTVQLTMSHDTASSSGSGLSITNEAGIETFTADHPFMFLVMVEPKMTPLFIGRFCGYE